MAFREGVRVAGLRFASMFVETTTILQSLRFLDRVFAAGAMAVVFIVFGSLLHGELARAWAWEIRRFLKRDHT